MTFWVVGWLVLQYRMMQLVHELLACGKESVILSNKNFSSIFKNKIKKLVIEIGGSFTISCLGKNYLMNLRIQFLNSS